MADHTIKTCINRISLSQYYSYLVEIIHKHLTHLIDWNCGIDGTI